MCVYICVYIYIHEYIYIYIHMLTQMYVVIQFKFIVYKYKVHMRI